MNSHLKFPRRVRIHGGECGAVARALHHEAQKDALMSYEQTLVMNEKAVLRQADLEKASRSTIERKQMSTKTTLKRVVLATVSALVLSLFATITPANALSFTGASSTGTTETGTITTANATIGTIARASANTWTVPVTVAISGSGMLSTDTFTVTGTLDAAAATATADGVGTVGTVTATVSSATSASLSFNVTITGTDATFAEVNLAAQSYSMVITAAIGSSSAASGARTFSLSDSAYFSSAAANNYSVSSSDNSNVSQLVNGVATLLFRPDSDFASYNITTNLGQITLVSAGSSGCSVGYVNGLSYTDGAKLTSCSSVADVTVTLTSAVAGAATVSFQPINATTGVPGTAVTGTVNWLAAATGALSDALTSVAIVSSSSAGCAYNASKANQDSNLALYGRSSMSYRDTDNGGRRAFICVIARDGNDNVVTSFDSVVLSLTAGSFATNGTITRVATSLTNSGNVHYTEFNGDNLAAGSATVSVTLIKGSASVTRTFPFTFYGKVTAVSLGQVTYAGAPADDTWYGRDYIDGTTAATASNTTVAFSITCKDANGSTVASCDVNGNGIADDTAYYVADSNATAGSPSYTATAPANSSDVQRVTITATLGGTASAVNALGSYVLVDANDPYAVAQKVGLKVCIADQNKTGNPASLCSDEGTYYLSDEAKDVAVTPAVASLDAGKSTTVNISAKDANGYPVADGTSVVLSATNGSVVTPAEKTTVNGAFTTASNFIAGSGSSTSLVTAVVGKASGVATMTINGSTAANSESAINAAADAAAEAIDAANAATDAANLAAEAADAATVAAEEARDAADAATAAVEELATQVATLMAALKAQITTLANTVAKIAKKVKA